MNIEISIKDIEESRIKTIDPITIVLRRKFGNRVSASRNFIRVLKKGSRKNKLFPLPQKATNYLLDYDYKLKSPLKFELNKKVVKSIRDILCLKK